VSVPPGGFAGRIAAAVRELMAEEGITVAAMSAATGISAVSLSARLTYRADFDVDELGLVAAALGISAGDVAVRAQGMLPASERR
jgi:hypothetical protein